MNPIASLLKPLVDQENLWCDPAELAAYALWPQKDASPANAERPLAVVRPVNLEQVSSVLSACDKENIPLAIRGAGTSFTVQASVGQRVLILTGGLKRILDFNERNRTLTVQAGVSSAGIVRAVGRRGLCFPPLPPRGSVSTMGGRLAVNAASQRTAKYGSLSAYVRQMEIVLLDGSRFQCAAQNGLPGMAAPGFPLVELMCGSRGSLAFIGSAELRLVPAPPLRRDILFYYGSFEEAADAVSGLLEARSDPVVLEVFHGLDLPVVGNLAASKQTCVWLAVEGSEETVEQEARECMSMLTKELAPLPVSAAGANLLAEARLSLGARSVAAGQLWQELRCPPDRMSAMVEGVGDILRRHELLWSACGPLLLSRLELFIQGGESSRLATVRQELFILERVLNGELRAEDELAQTREEWRHGERDLFGLCQKLRKVFDPHDLLGWKA